MNRFPANLNLNREDLLLLLLIFLLLTGKGKDNWEVLVGLAFLFLAGLREREKRGGTGATHPGEDAGLIPFDP